MMEALLSDNKSASIKFHNQDSNLTASLSGGGSTKTGQVAQRAELVYKPEFKLTKGIYSFNVYEGKDYMGSVQMRLK